VPLTIIPLLQVALWTGLLGVPLWATYRKGNGPVIDFGLAVRWWPDLPAGVAAGLATQLLLVPVLYAPFLRFLDDADEVGRPARELADKADGSPGGVVLLVLVVVIGAPIVEEIFFRGLLLRSIERRAGTWWAVALSSLVFGVFHFQPLQFPALVVAGLVFALLTVWTKRLGAAICAHMAFNGVTVAVLVAS
jgi:membrane protease YdiL (CAAX protease family)